MIKIKSQINQKLLQNFSNQSFPDITIITQTSKYNLTLAYLIIDSQYFNSLPPEATQINLSSLAQKPLVQVLRALYGDVLIAYSISELEELYKVIDFLDIDQYRKAIVNEIKNNKVLMENLEVLEFCNRNNLIVQQVNKFHIQNKLRALENNKNFLQLNKISLNTLINLLLAFYNQVNEAGVSIINNILQNYFNRNNIKVTQFFQQHTDVDVLLNIWQQFHHTLHIDRKSRVSNTQMMRDSKAENPLKKSGIERPNTQLQTKKLQEQQALINQLKAKIDDQQKQKAKLKRQLFSLTNESNRNKPTRRITSTPIQTVEGQDDISIIEINKMSSKDLILKNIKSDFQAKSQNRMSNKYIPHH